MSLTLERHFTAEPLFPVPGAAIVGQNLREPLPRSTKRTVYDVFIRHSWEHRWTLGDLLIWDNRCPLHRANTNFDAARFPRVLQRTCLRGAAPV